MVVRDTGKGRKEPRPELFGGRIEPVTALRAGLVYQCGLHPQCIRRALAARLHGENNYPAPAFFRERKFPYPHAFYPAIGHTPPTAAKRISYSCLAHGLVPPPNTTRCGRPQLTSCATPGMLPV